MHQNKRASSSRIKIGSRVKHSELGLSILNPKNPMRLGTVLDFSRSSPDLVRVVWDGTRSPQTYCVSFVVRVIG